MEVNGISHERERIHLSGFSYKGRIIETSTCKASGCKQQEWRQSASAQGQLFGSAKRGHGERDFERRSASYI